MASLEASPALAGEWIDKSSKNYIVGVSAICWLGEIRFSDAEGATAPETLRQMYQSVLGHLESDGHKGHPPKEQAC